MRWKKISDSITVIVLSIILAINTLLNILGPLHMNATGGFNTSGYLTLYSLLYFILALVIIWWIYFALRKKPESSFFTLIIVGIILIIGENFLWAWKGI